MGDAVHITDVLAKVLGRDYLMSDRPDELAAVRYVRSLDKRHFYQVSFAKVCFALVLVKEDAIVSLDSLQHEVRRVAAAQPMPVVVYWEHATAAQTEEMRRLGIPYLTGAGGCFLPFLWLNIPAVEWAAGAVSVRVEKTAPLSPCAQVIVLRQLLYGDVAGKTIRLLAQQLPYSAGLLGKAKDELVSLNLCAYPAGTRSGRFIFPVNRHDLWLKAEPHLQSPVRQSFITKDLADERDYPAAGISALSMVSDLTDDPMPTCAYYQRAVAGRLTPAPLGVEGIRVQRWIYPPTALMTENSNRVDDLSLYLSLRNNHDPRVRLALETIPLP